MAGKLTKTEGQIARDLAHHAAGRMTQAFDDAAALCLDPKQRAHIALHMLASMVGLASAEIDRAEGRQVAAGEVSPEAHGLIMSVFGDMAPAGRSALARHEAEGGERA